MALRGTLRPLKVRRRREMLPQQVGFVCAVLALVCCASGLFGSLGWSQGFIQSPPRRAGRARPEELMDALGCGAGSPELRAAPGGAQDAAAGHKTASASKRVLPDTWRNRKLMAPVNGTQTAKNCTDPAIHEFPTDLFSNKERQHGAVLLHILGALYMFYALAIVCDDFFVPSLEKICERLHLSEDVAGATFMAAGSSTPELFASVIGVFITHGDVGVGTIVGSAVFNILCIIGVCGLFAGQVVRLTWWAVCRDSVYYTISVIVLIVFIYDEQIVWWEGLVLIILYVFYILIMKYNVKMQAFFTVKQKSIANGNPVNSELEAVKEKPQYGKNPVVMVDEIMSSSPPKFTFPEAGLRIMITNKFGPRTRLRMASRIIINERQRLINSANGVSSKPLQNGRHENIENGNVPVENPEDPQQNQEQQPPPQPPPPEPEPVEADFLSPFSVPEARGDKVKWVFTWPLIFLLCVTIPNCSKPRWEKFFMVTFITATLWIAVFSYIMVWLVTIIGYTLGIPDVIMGITFLAAGTSVPDCMASLIVARQGLGDMAVSNTIGSNVFDILVGLGVPWGLQTMVVNYGSTVKINSRGLVYSVVLLLGSVALTVLGIHLNKWRLDRKLGVYVLVLYAIFLCFSIMIEFNVFTFVNLPMCREDD
ncbi:sodium/potassium/calcium exchanger 4 isoform X2 [Homo sapiens]|uniref:sodium/potassium/calcium exchanger 4 isoform X2 n=1 Tax=Homo sapiens TaxID=9606 RepID=UPI0005D022F6|nr:sodium/potassium/calcium exchanger 4 isoform X2 [Homo sapiens]XP_054231381.1 sodium/potassium/calcium exchanger 4 isoform X2 [Homo sapiens]|eukprot:XP_011534739.1 sodium/potassium/calcium exchanger 4 isoform X2 [Homo sapiens]